MNKGGGTLPNAAPFSFFLFLYRLKCVCEPRTGRKMQPARRPHPHGNYLILPLVEQVQFRSRVHPLPGNPETYQVCPIHDTLA